MLFSSLADGATRNLENPSTPLSDPASWLFHALGATPTASKMPVNQQTALQLTAYWQGVNIISNVLGQIPLQLVRKLDDNQTEEIDDHPTLSLLNLKPNPEASAITWKSTVQSHVLSWGSGYSWIRRAVTGPVELWPLQPNRTRAKRDAVGKLFFEAQLSRDTKLETAEFPAEDIIHVPGLTFNGLTGLSPIRVQREMLGTALAVQDFAARFFGNSAIPSGVLTFPKKLSDADALRKQLEDKFGGENALRMMIADQGAKYERIGIPPEDAQFLETRKFGVEEIARMLNIPPHFLAVMGQATFSNLESMGTHFVTYTMLPWLIRWEQELTVKLLTREEILEGLAYKFKVAGLMRGDQKGRYLSYQSGINAGWLTRNEARSFEKLNPIEGLDEPLQPLNMLTVGDDDDDDDDEGKSSNNDRIMIIIRQAASRCIRREVKGVNRLLKKYADNIDEFTRQLSMFYEAHADILIDHLAVAPLFARQYCDAHESLVLQHRKQFGDVSRQWLTCQAAELADYAVRANSAIHLLGDNSDVEQSS